MKLVIDLNHDSIDVVQAVFAAYHANTPKSGAGDAALNCPAESLAANPTVAEPPKRRGRKPAVQQPPVVEQAPQGELTAEEPAAPAETYEQFMKWVSEGLQYNTLPLDRMKKARESLGIKSMLDLQARPELIPDLRKALES